MRKFCASGNVFGKTSYTKRIWFSTCVRCFTQRSVIGYDAVSWPDRQRIRVAHHTLGGRQASFRNDIILTVHVLYERSNTSGQNTVRVDSGELDIWVWVTPCQYVELRDHDSGLCTVGRPRTYSVKMTYSTGTLNQICKLIIQWMLWN